MAQQVYSMAISQNVAGQFAANILHWQFDDAGFASTIAAAKSLADAWILTNDIHFRNMVPNDTAFLSIRIRRVTGGGGFEYVGVYPGGTVGQRSGTLLAAAVSPCLIVFGLGATRARGRIFLCGVTATDCIEGVFTNAFQTAVRTQIPLAFADLALVGGGAPTALQVIGKKTTPFYTSKYKIELSDKPATQRRRQTPT